MRKSIGRLMAILHRQSQIYYNNTLKDLNISSAEYPFLLYLFSRDGASQEEMSCYLNIDKAATARAVKSLEEKGYVTREKADSDKRVNHVFLTEKANEIELAMKKKITGWSDLLTEGMSGESIEEMTQILEEMVNKVEKRNIRNKTEDKR
ncbi:MarR family winged helix-turn-helix transcriptional regulator [Alkalibacter mobilis]|uniref:MarR family winged helix-turn-helix transcriptional regulator n=1 Tax=Alkalibacter mobilis TaxID=2787712 RepID=UPI00189EBD4A|nr:MarR family winged helix-turn-helix transcriptional regulator [Alkalibacter mobilis]MBF7096376.1 winged helix-turn-helix transcriptional regulator [Alkalibacter mobilis]